MSKYSTKLTTANCTQPLKAQLRAYIEWLEKDPTRRAYVFPKTGRLTNVNRVRDELLFAVNTIKVEVDPFDYVDLTVVDEGAEEVALAA